MDPNEREVCVCFHVSLGKLAKHHRLNHPRFASQMSDCYGAGTGCGWCIPFLERIYEQMQRGEEPSIRMSGEEYRRRRLRYHATGTRDLSEPESSELPDLEVPNDPTIPTPAGDNPAAPSATDSKGKGTQQE